MLLLYLEGKKLSEIAKIFKVSDQTVRNSLTAAVEQGYGKALERVETDLIADLVPMALQVYKDKLSGPDPDVLVAKDVIDKMVKLGDRQSNNKQHQQKMGLEAYMATRRLEKGQNASSPETQPQNSPVVDAAPVARENFALSEKAVIEDLVENGLSQDE